MERCEDAKDLAASVQEDLLRVTAVRHRFVLVVAMEGQVVSGCGAEREESSEERGRDR